MKQTTKLLKYTKLFRKNIQKYLEPEMKIITNIYPIKEKGAIFEFMFNKDSDKETIKGIEETLLKSFLKIKQEFIDEKNITFKGTNLLLEDNRIIIIKSTDEPILWNGETIKDDVKRIIKEIYNGKN